MESIWTAEGVKQLIAGGTPFVLVVVRTLVVYVLMVLGLRLTGKREIGQFTTFDLVLILLIANAVQNAMVGADNTLIGGLIAAATLLAVNWTVGVIADRRPAFGRWLLGHPRVLVRDGEVVQRNLRAEDITLEELDAAIREHGLDKTSDVRLAMLEVDGSISVVPKDSKPMRSRRRVRQIKHG